MKYSITIWNTVDMSRDIELESPELRRYEYTVTASSKEKAYDKAKELYYKESSKGIWEHTIEPLD